MKVLVYGLNHAPEVVGIGRYSGELAQWLASDGHRLRVITAPPYFPQWQAQGNRYRSESLGDVEVMRCPLWVPTRPSGMTRLLHLASFALSSLPVLLAQRRWRPAVVLTVAPSVFCAPAALMLVRLCGKGCHSWLHIQDFELDAAFELGILKGGWMRALAEQWERQTLQGFERVSTISEAMRQRLIEKGVDSERAVLLPNWVDLQAIRPQDPERRAANPYRRELGLRPETRILMYSGSMNRKQGLEVLVEAMERLADVPDLVWILAGEGPTRAELAQTTERYDNVRMLPLQPTQRLDDWLNLADIHLLPQKAVAADLVLPSKLLGILASGRPVVAGSPSQSELGELAQQAGIRVEPENGEEFAAALRCLLNDTELCLRLGERARQLAEERFGREAVLGELERKLIELTC